MQSPEAFSHPVAGFKLYETHISWVLLTGPYAYKFKKPLDLGFADYSSLEKRRTFCEEELRLNRRLAPDLYLDVVAVTGDVQRPRVGGEGEAIEYCVRMAQFPDADRLDKVIERGELETAQIDSIAEQIARFHRTVLRADPDSRYGTPERILERVLANFFELEEVTELGESRRDRLKELETWSRTRHKELDETFRQRRRDGFVRECHGDIHLGNMALWKSRVIIFDAI